MEGVIVNFRRSIKKQYSNQAIVKLNIDSKDQVKSFLDKEAVWKSEGNREIKGKIAAVHGRNGCVRVIFEKGLPGQAIGTKISIL